MLDKNSIEDKKVIRRIQSGEAEDSQILIEKYYQEIFRFSYYMTGNKEDAYDCTQETFLKMIRYIGQYKEMQKFKAWLFQIARNVCYDGFRREKGDSFGNFQRVCTGRISGNTGEIYAGKADVGKSTRCPVSASGYAERCFDPSVLS